MMIDITIPGEPSTATAQERKIAWAQRRTYLPAAARKAKNDMINALRPYAPDKPIDSPLQADITFRFSRPKSVKKGKRWKDRKPDVDNICKSLFDSFQIAGIITNDSRICDLHVRKMYSDTPCISIILTTLDD